MTLRDRWFALWKGLGAPPPEDLLTDLLSRYEEPHRAYHTLRHLEECFAALDAAAHLADRPSEVELGLWFHDAVYDTRAPDSEERSARFARKALFAAGLGDDRSRRVEGLVLATKHDGVPEAKDERLLVDADLAILGAADARFDEYERQVRREYDWVPDAAFRDARRRILAGLLARPRLFGTDWFAERLEARARANLERSLRALAG